MNYHIHLGKNEREINQGINVCAVISSNAMFDVSQVKGGRLGFLWIKDLKPNGVSLYIHDGMGSTSPY